MGFFSDLLALSFFSSHFCPFFTQLPINCLHFFCSCLVVFSPTLFLHTDFNFSMCNDHDSPPFKIMDIVLLTKNQPQGHHMVENHLTSTSLTNKAAAMILQVID